MKVPTIRISSRVRWQFNWLMASVAWAVHGACALAFYLTVAFLEPIRDLAPASSIEWFQMDNFLAVLRGFAAMFNIFLAIEFFLLLVAAICVQLDERGSRHS